MAKPYLQGFEDNAVKLYDLQGKELQHFSSNASAMFAVAFSPDGQNLLIASTDDVVQLYDLQGKELQSLSHYMVSAVGFSPDGKNILTGWL